MEPRRPGALARIRASTGSKIIRREFSVDIHVPIIFYCPTGNNLLTHETSFGSQDNALPRCLLSAVFLSLSSATARGPAAICIHFARR